MPNKLGRPRIVTDTQIDYILTEVESGIPLKYACALAEPFVNEETILERIAQGDNVLLSRLTRARAKFVQSSIKTPDRDNWPKYSFILERCFRETFSRNPDIVQQFNFGAPVSEMPSAMLDQKAKLIMAGKSPLLRRKPYRAKQAIAAKILDKV